MQTLRIFISSPGDVAEERQVAGKVIERLQGKYWSFVRLDEVFWEDRVVRSTAHYQDELLSPAECEIVVGVLWSRLGSPLPEKFRKKTGERYRSGTEWELETAFNAFEAHRHRLLHSGAPEDEANRLAKPDIITYRRTGPLPAAAGPGGETEAAAQLSRLEAYLRENYWFPDGAIRRPITSYAGLGEFETKLSLHLEELILRHIPKLKPGFEPPPISGSPFKGLQAFDFADSDRYFGRNREIREIQQLLLANARKGFPFLLIYGGSGYGKSSLMRAGLAPVLTRPGGSLERVRGWRRVSFQPAKGGGALVERLARALLQPPSPEEAGQSRDHDHWPLTGLPEITAQNAEGAPWDCAALSRHFADDERRADAIAAIVRTLESLDRHLLLEIDQLEEIFTHPGIDGAQRSAFLRTIGPLCETGRVWTVATMRSEFFPRVAEQPELRALVGRDHGYILPPPDRQSLREIIRYPALAARLDFERRVHEIKIAGERAKHDYLHDQILADAADSPDALPLLEFSLQQLYLKRSGNLLTWASYAKAGGLKGSIAQRAASVYQFLDPAAREARHRIYAALVHVDPSRGTVTRRRAPLASLGSHPGSGAFLRAFLDARLLVTDEDGPAGEPVVTLVHEALISHWEELSTWINDHRGDLLARQRLAEQAQLWQDNGQKKSYLLSEARLAEAARVAESRLFTLTENEGDFLRLSRQRAKKKLRALQTAVAVFAVVAAAAAFFAWKSKTALEAEAAQKKIAQHEQYLSGVRLANESLKVDNKETTREQLLSLPASERNWEWDALLELAGPPALGFDIERDPGKLYQGDPEVSRSLTSAWKKLREMPAEDPSMVKTLTSPGGQLIVLRDDMCGGRHYRAHVRVYRSIEHEPVLDFETNVFGKIGNVALSEDNSLLLVHVIDGRPVKNVSTIDLSPDDFENGYPDAYVIPIPRRVTCRKISALNTTPEDDYGILKADWRDVIQSKEVEDQNPFIVSAYSKKAVIGGGRWSNIESPWDVNSAKINILNQIDELPSKEAEAAEQIRNREESVVRLHSFTREVNGEFLGLFNCIGSRHAAEVWNLTKNELVCELGEGVPRAKEKEKVYEIYRVDIGGAINGNGDLALVGYIKRPKDAPRLWDRLDFEGGYENLDMEVDNTIGLFEIPSGKAVRVFGQLCARWLDRGALPKYGFDFSSSKAYYYSFNGVGSVDSMISIDLNTGKVEMDEFWYLNWSPDGKIKYYAKSGQDVMTISPASHPEIKKQIQGFRVNGRSVVGYDKESQRYAIGGIIFKTGYLDPIINFGYADFSSDLNHGVIERSYGTFDLLTGSIRNARINNDRSGLTVAERMVMDLIEKTDQH